MILNLTIKGQKKLIRSALLKFKLHQLFIMMPQCLGKSMHDVINKCIKNGI